jgi:predicted amidohydrolase YtcJ
MFGSIGLKRGAAAVFALAAMALAFTALLPEAGAQEVHRFGSCDTILYNGDIWTVDDKKPTAEAIAINDGKIIAVGSNEEVLKLRELNTFMLDLKGAFVVPGFNDSHIHFNSASAFHEFNIMRAGTQEEFVERVKATMERLPQGEWITGGLWGAYDQWAFGAAGGEGRKPFAPDMRLINDLTADYPMFIGKFDSSEFAANKAAFKAAGLDWNKPQAEGVEFVRDASGAFTGVMKGRGARRLFRPPPVSFERRVAQARNALRMIAEAGVTNVSDISNDASMEIYRYLHARGELTARIHCRYDLGDYERIAALGHKIGAGDEWLRLGCLKSYVDGIMGTSGARFFEPYDSDPEGKNRGIWRPLLVDEAGNFVEGKFMGYMSGADKAGFQLSVHSIGDEGNNLLLNYVEELIKLNGPKERRFRLVHAQVIAPDDFKRLGPLGFVAEVQPYHVSDDMRWMEERIGHERCKGAYAFKRIAAAGAVLSFGTDWPGTSAAEYPINPMLALYAAVSRQTVNGEPKEGWFPDERLDIKTCIKAYTWGSAFANWEEDLKGSITVGKLADITVLDHNLLKIEPKEYLNTKPLYTIVDGKIVYEKK